MGIGAIVGAVAGGVGNYFAAKDAQKQANKNQRRAEQHELNILKNQVSWRVDDAMRAGLHPLAALGMNPASTGVGAAGAFQADYGSMGADLGRAIDSVADPKDKVAAAATQLMFEKTALENEYTKTQVANQRLRNMQMAGPGVPGGSTNPADEYFAVPGTDIKWKVHNPRAADTAESHYGEAMSEIMGWLGSANDIGRYMKLENIMTAGPLAHQAGTAARNWLLGKKAPDDFFVEDAAGNRYK